MIERKYVFPECYIVKIPKCDDCKVILKDNNMMLSSNPPKWQYVCPKCNKDYCFRSDELQGEWKWRNL